MSPTQRQDYMYIYKCMYVYMYVTIKGIIGINKRW